jgi:hypothetical protein
MDPRPGKFLADPRRWPNLRGIAPRADHKIIADSGQFTEIEHQYFKGLFAVRGPGAQLRGFQ